MAASFAGIAGPRLTWRRPWRGYPHSPRTRPRPRHISDIATWFARIAGFFRRMAFFFWRAWPRPRRTSTRMTASFGSRTTPRPGCNRHPSASCNQSNPSNPFTLTSPSHQSIPPTFNLTPHIPLHLVAFPSSRSLSTASRSGASRSSRLLVMPLSVYIVFRC